MTEKLNARELQEFKKVRDFLHKNVKNNPFPCIPICKEIIAIEQRLAFYNEEFVITAKRGNKLSILRLLAQVANN